MQSNNVFDIPQVFLQFEENPKTTVSGTRSVSPTTCWCCGMTLFEEFTLKWWHQSKEPAWGREVRLAFNQLISGVCPPPLLMQECLPADKLTLWIPIRSGFSSTSPVSALALLLPASMSLSHRVCADLIRRPVCVTLRATFEPLCYQSRDR